MLAFLFMNNNMEPANMIDISQFHRLKQLRNSMKDFQTPEELDNCITDLLNDDSLPTVTPNERQLLNSYRGAMVCQKRMDPSSMELYLNIMSYIPTKDEGNRFLSELHDKTMDPAQLNAFKRIVKSKSDDHPLNVTKNEHHKQCPHCGRVNHFINSVDSYIICGYSARGFDWKGCGHDWCFDCGKKLCKQWENNSLYVQSNRQHDTQCCTNHARSIGDNFLTNYCQCNNKNVSR